MVATNKNKVFGLKVVAVFEAVKSIAILVVGFGLLSLINHDVSKTAESLIRHLHLNPASKYPHIFIEAASHVTNAQLWTIAALAFVDAIVRLVVAYGLWYDRTWAKWLGAVIAGIYIPLEIYEIGLHITALKMATFLTNVAIVVYLSFDIYWSKHSERDASASSATRLPDPDLA